MSAEPEENQVRQLLALVAAGRPAEAEAAARQMTRTFPDRGLVWKALGYALVLQQRFAEALPVLEQSLRLSPSEADTHNNLGFTLRCLGRTDDAEASYLRALALNPDFPEALCNRGNLLKELGRLAESESSFRRALELKPADAEALNDLGSVLMGLERFAEALASFERALQVAPDFAQAHCNRGTALKGVGRNSDAEASYRRALELRPEFAEALSNLGDLLRRIGRPEDAERVVRKALALQPQLAEAHNNLGNALRDLGRLEEAEQSYRRALMQKPDYVNVYVNLGVTLQNVGRLEEAEQCYRQALALKPDFAGVHSNLIFMLDLREDCTVSEQQAERRRWFAQHAVQHAQIVTPHENVPDPERRLRVGYVSADFYRHSASLVFSPVICRRDRAAFEVICYSGVTREDDVTARLRQAADVWRSTLGESDEALAEQIRRDRIDILVDLSGHSSGNRLLVFARKPAPVQVTAWGYSTGTGLQTMDYFFADPVLVPVEERANYAEEVIDLPCCVCYDAPAYLPEVSALPSLGGQPLTFGCVNRVEKISDRVIGLWGQILSALPEARLLLKDGKLDNPGLRRDVLRRLADAGIQAGRVQLLGHSDHAEHLRTYHQVDLGLDPYPHGGGVSTLEALWMGVPVVTLKGPTLTSRLSASILTGLQMQDWTAASDEQYVRIAIEAAGNPSRLGALRAGLRARMAASPLGDLQRYTQTVETVYRSLWRRWCATRAGPEQQAVDHLLALVSVDRETEAEAAARQMTRTWPESAVAWKALGYVLVLQRRFAEALPALAQALRFSPADANAHNSVGFALQGLGRPSDAEVSYRRALKLNPGYAQAHGNLGNVLKDLDRLPEAESSLRHALELNPEDPELHNNLGSVLLELLRTSEALDSFSRALQLRPASAVPHCNQGTALKRLGRLPEAESSYRRALQLDPAFAEAHDNLGNLLTESGRYTEAEASCRRALALKPDLSMAHCNLGNALMNLGRLTEAESSYRRALQLRPGFSAAHTNLIFTLDLIESRLTHEQQEERHRWHLQHARRYADAVQPHDNVPDPERRLRIGYVSADFCRQSPFYIFGPVICGHDQSKFDVLCYSEGQREDDATARLRGAALEWRAISGMSDEALAAQIRRDRIDILVDLSGHMAGNRLLAFARKPAPVQVTAWGYANGTGLQAMDYLLADRVALPEEDRVHYAEEVIDLPCIVCYEPPEYLPAVSPLPAAGGKPFTFACVNRLEKISERSIKLWSRILGSLPEARLLVKGWGFHDSGLRATFLKRLEDANVDTDQVRLLGHSPHAAHLETYREVDLVLDSYPHGGGVSTLEALWMGVPVVTLKGPTLTSRLSASILTALQMHDWIATSDDDYVRIAIEAARYPTRLSAMRRGLRDRTAASAIGDVQRYSRAVESAYRNMWRRWCSERNAPAKD